MEKLIRLANKIHKNKKPSSNYIHLNEDYIQQLANEKGVSFDEMVEIIKKELMPSK